MTDVGGIAAKRLRSFVERIERLEAERAVLAEDLKEVYAEAKGAGFDTGIMKKVIVLRKMDEYDREEMEQLLDNYKRNLGL